MSFDFLEQKYYMQFLKSSWCCSLVRIRVSSCLFGVVIWLELEFHVSKIYLQFSSKHSLIKCYPVVVNIISAWYI